MAWHPGLLNTDFVPLLSLTCRRATLACCGQALMAKDTKAEAGLARTLGRWPSCKGL